MDNGLGTSVLMAITTSVSAGVTEILALREPLISPSQTLLNICSAGRLRKSDKETNPWF